MKEKKTSIGGQALIEGIMMVGPRNSAMAVRAPGGEIVLEEFQTKKNSRPKFFRAPLIRGAFNMFDSLRVGYRCLMRSAELAGLEEDDKKEGKSFWDRLFSAVLMPLAVVLAFALGFFLFMYMPTQLYRWLQIPMPFLADQRFIQSTFEGVVRIAIFVLYIWAISRMKDIHRTFQYHGAEHKTIFCYEQGKPLTVENIRAQRRFHPRCGTSFLMLMLVVGIVVAIFIPTDIPTLLRVTIKVLCLPIVVSIGYELLKLAGRVENTFTRVISAPGMWLQRITTQEPDDDMIECAIAAMEKVIPGDGSDNW